MGSDTLKPGWTRVAFGDVVRLSAARVSDPEAAGFGRYVGLEHLDPGDLTIRRWGDVAAGTTFTSVFRPGHVLFGKRRAYQRKVAVPDFSGVCSGDIYVLESTNEHHLLPNLLPFICQTDGFFEHAIGTSAGSLSPRTNWKSLAAYEFALPPLDEQRTLAATLAAANATRASCEDLRVAASSLLITVSHEIFSALHNDPSVPKRRLGELILCDISNGIFRRREQFGSGLPLINVTDCYLGFRVPVSRLEKVRVADSEYVFFSAEPGDVIFNRSSLVLSGIGHACLVPKSEETLVFECHLMRARPNREILSGAYLARFALSPIGRRYMLSRAQTTTMTTIAQDVLRDMFVPCPDIGIQDAIAAKLDAIDEAVESIRARQVTTVSISSTLLNSIWPVCP